MPRDHALHIVVDIDRCMGHALCLGFAPGIFNLDDDEAVAQVLFNPIPEDRRAEVEMAVRRCPTNALRIE